MVAATASRPTGREGFVAPGRGGDRSPEPPRGRSHPVPTPTKDFGRGGASSPGQGKEDFDAGLPSGPLTLGIDGSLVTTGIRGDRWLDLSHKLRLARTGQQKPRERFATGDTTRERKREGERERGRDQQETNRRQPSTLGFWDQVWPIIYVQPEQIRIPRCQRAAEDSPHPPPGPPGEEGLNWAGPEIVD